MRILLDLLVAFLPRLFAPVVDLIKSEALKLYVKGVDIARTAFIFNLIAVFGVMLALAGFVIMHIAAYFLLPWSSQTNAFILLGLGLLYFAVPTIYILRICSQKTWLKISGAEAMARKLSND